ncbi:MAG TPA: hypothetical protein DDY88_04610, partial [Actinobacteria bacterium]|nr:hypothetical protein [Actinomycetota bacterium]
MGWDNDLVTKEYSVSRRHYFATARVRTPRLLGTRNPFALTIGGLRMSIGPKHRRRNAIVIGGMSAAVA